ncbi:MAG: methyltransferase domain-containing protein, partial [Verrucomicrobia bacterium]|nr:methyltransferase domain-containing protein [Verrucomicrobiota bacterium]
MRNTTSGQVARLSKVETRGLETTHLDFGKSSYWLRHAAALTVLIVSMWCSAAEVRSTSALLEWLRAPSGPAGFCVHLGCGEGALTIELAAGDRLAVHALEAEARNVEKARERLQARDLYGQATVEQWAMKSLPYAENLVNVLIAENPGAIPQTEMLRVVAPLGTLWVKHGDGWRSEQKPWPRAFDEWTHWRHGPDGNMVSRDTAVTTPTGLRWIAGPPQDVGGRKWYYDHVLVSSSGRNFYQFDDAIVARDSFNGRLLWRREAKAHTFKETITFGTLKLGGRTSKVRPVASGERLYAATDGKLVALDAANGRTVQTFGDLNAPREIALVWRVLLATDADGIRAFELDGKLGWQSDEKSRRMVAGDGRVFLLSDDRVTCLDLATGAVCWRASHPSAVNAVTCSYYRGVLVLERASWSDHAPGNGVVALAGDTGAVLWTKDFRPGMT